MNISRVNKIFAGFSRCRIMVVGDVMLDRYLYGSASRISPEAPVPVVEINREEHLLGGAANVACNILTLGGKANLVGVIGADQFGNGLRRLLAKKGLATGGILTDRGRPTTVKTRIIAGSQQIVRADREKTTPLSETHRKRLMKSVSRLLPQVEAVIISDYGKGVIEPQLVAWLVENCRRRGIFIAVDPKEAHFFSYRQVSAITPNHHEASFVAGRRIIDDRSLQEVGWRLLRELDARSLLITLGEKGMALFEANSSTGKESLTKIPAMARKVYDVTGAGDTVIAVFTLAAAAGATLKEAAFIANVAAGEVVAEMGTAQVERSRLKELVVARLAQTGF